MTQIWHHPTDSDMRFEIFAIGRLLHIPTYFIIMYNVRTCITDCQYKSYPTS